jgi:ribosomal peptide maturation radical SAM protein 1
MAAPRRTDIVFAVTPFGDVRWPAIGVSTLHADALRRGFASLVEYLNVDLAAWIGEELYTWIGEMGGQVLLDESTPPTLSLVGEWFFAGQAFPGELPADEEYLARFIAPYRKWRERLAALVEARNRFAAAFVEHSAREILKHRPRVVGFTTSFEQTCCCLAIARRLKQEADAPTIIFGGANCEGRMGLELIRSFPWIDYLCTGQGDAVLSGFLDRYLRQGDPNPPQGILRQGHALELSTPPSVKVLDDLPVPEYSDFFARLERSSLAVDPSLPIETARGCWWGEKHHCTFCGLNGEAMGYRSKSPQRVLNELSALSDTYPPRRVVSVDNILDVRYIDTIFPELHRRGSGLELFYEIKANLRYDQLATMYRGGVRAVQPGIESLSTRVLQIMRKGSTAAQNIQLLRWCRELDILPAWNLLFGFPDEPADEYRRMAELIPLLVHLKAPSFCSRLRLDRFSPLYDQAAAFGIQNVRPMEAYSYVYPLPESALRNLAYYFDFDYGDGRRPEDYAQPVVAAVEQWAALAQGQGSRPRLDAFAAGSLVIVEDTRPCAVEPVHLLSGLAARIYTECDSATSASALARQLRAPESDVREIADRLQAQNLMVATDNRLLSLAVFRTRAAQPQASAAAEPKAATAAELVVIA